MVLTTPPPDGFRLSAFTQMSCKTSIYNALRPLHPRKSKLSTSRVLVHKSAFSRSISLGTNHVHRNQRKAGDQSRRDISTTHVRGHVKNGVLRNAVNSMPINTSSECSIKNETRWKSFAPAKSATGTLCAGRSILLTGGTSGIGLAVAKRAVLEGASHIIIVSRRPSKGARAVQAITEATECPDAPVSYLSHDFSTSSPEVISTILKPLVSQAYLNNSPKSLKQSHRLRVHVN